MLPESRPRAKPNSHCRMGACFRKAGGIIVIAKSGRYNGFMLRDPALIPLSRQHQHALALCVRVQRALASEGKSSAADVAAFEQEVASLFEVEIRYHFAAEEQVLFPAAARHGELRSLVDELIREHGALREQVQAAAQQRLGAAGLVEFAAQLSYHIRKEERRLFEEMQRVIPPDELQKLGVALDAWLVQSGMPGAACALPGSQ